MAPGYARAFAFVVLAMIGGALSFLSAAYYTLPCGLCIQPGNICSCLASPLPVIGLLCGVLLLVTGIAGYLKSRAKPIEKP